MSIPIKTDDSGSWPKVRALGYASILNLQGRTNLLLDLVYRQGCIPVRLSCADGVAVNVVIDGRDFGGTDLSVHFGIWRMVENYRTLGVLFDEDFERDIRTVIAQFTPEIDLVVA